MIRQVSIYFCFLIYYPSFSASKSLFSPPPSLVRASDGSVIQFRYGEDAIDVSNCQYLKKFDFVAENFDGFLHKYGVKKIPQAVDTASVEVHKRKAQKAKRAWDRANEKYIEVCFCLAFWEI